MRSPIIDRTDALREMFHYSTQRATLAGARSFFLALDGPALMHAGAVLTSRSSLDHLSQKRGNDAARRTAAPSAHRQGVPGEGGHPTARVTPGDLPPHTTAPVWTTTVGRTVVRKRPHGTWRSARAAAPHTACSRGPLPPSRVRHRRCSLSTDRVRHGDRASPVPPSVRRLPAAASSRVGRRDPPRAARARE